METVRKADGIYTPIRDRLLLKPSLSLCTKGCLEEPSPDAWRGFEFYFLIIVHIL